MLIGADGRRAHPLNRPLNIGTTELYVEPMFYCQGVAIIATRYRQIVGKVSEIDRS